MLYTQIICSTKILMLVLEFSLSFLINLFSISDFITI